MSSPDTTIGVLTTIASPTDCVRHLHSFCGDQLQELIVVGDRKGPESYALNHAKFLPLAAQATMGLSLSSLLPENHYSRKNLGFLHAVQRGADAIYETDDDTMPTAPWTSRASVQQVTVVEAEKWGNAFRFFTEKHIWPRGLPLDEIHNDTAKTLGTKSSDAPIQQGMIDLSPDVDAVWRLVFGDEFYFDQGKSIMMSPNTWCPFNSQNTWWRPEAFPLLYLPSYCEFRATDIWRGFIAQRCVWELGCGIVFHGPDTVQHRNVHNLMTDFEGEISGYLRNQEITDCLSKLTLLKGKENVSRNLKTCYEALVGLGVFPEKELDLVSSWRADLENCLQSQQTVKRAA